MPETKAIASATRKVVINVCFGGFGLSEAAYVKLIEWGVPVRPYIKQERGEDGLYQAEPRNEGEIIFDRDISESRRGSELEAAIRRLTGRYWETWLDYKRDHPLLIRVLEELGEAANGNHASLRIVEIPADVEYTVEEYDGNEHIAQVHQTWR